MEIPEKIEEWTLDTVKEVVRKHEFEPGRFDYKAALKPDTRTSDPDLIPSIRRTACSMANADGGFIIFGVLDRGIKARSPDERIVGIALGKDLLKQFGELVQVIQPDIYFEAIPAPIKLPEPAKGIFVVSVPTSPRRPHMVEAAHVFYRRGPNGTAIPMDYYEVREQMLNSEERLRKVTLLRLEIEQYQEQAQKLVDYRSGSLLLFHFDTRAFKLILADICTLLPTEDHLLKDLLDVPILANLTHEALTRYGTNGAKTYALLLNQLCDRCQQRLNKLFGPIGFEGKPSAR